MTTTLTPTPNPGTITNHNPPPAPRCGLNEIRICCKESDTAHRTRPPGGTPGRYRPPDTLLAFLQAL
jgi:hypothetical protein